MDEDKAAEVLVWVMPATMAYGVRGRYEDAKARGCRQDSDPVAWVWHALVDERGVVDFQPCS